MITFIQENSFIILFALPVIYIVLRDINSIIKVKRQKKEDEIKMRESEERIIKLMKQLNLNREDLVKQLSKLQNKIEFPQEDQIPNEDDSKKT